MDSQYTTVPKNGESKLKYLGDNTKKFFKSRWCGLLLGPVYGYFLYLYLTYMIFSGPPFTPSPPNKSFINQDNTTKHSTQFYDGGSGQNCGIDGIIKDISKFVKLGNNTFVPTKKNIEPTNPFDKEAAVKTCKPLMTVETRYVISMIAVTILWGIKA